MTDFPTIVIAPDSFKGSLSAQQVCDHLTFGMKKAVPGLRIESVPLADGGEGTVEAILHALGGKWVRTMVHDPLGRKIESRYGMVSVQKLAVIEMAAASGLELLSERELDPLRASTYGTGELIFDGLEQGCEKFIIGIGGSATNDGGIGMLQALGATIHYDHNASPEENILKGISFVDLTTLDPRLKEVTFEVACDVTNPLTGEQGATRIFGPQKGVTIDMMADLEKAMIRYGNLLEAAAQKPITEVAGAGAAGGLGAGLLALPQVTLRSGFEIVSEAIQLEAKIREAGLVVTGEGKVDDQTLYGKVPFGVAGLAAKYDIPVICVAGTVGSGIDILLKHGISSVFSILQKPGSLEEAKKEAPKLLEDLGEQLLRLIQSTRGIGS